MSNRILDKVELTIDPWWITGFFDGEGCFSISFNLKESFKSGLEVRPSVSIAQKKDTAGLNLYSLTVVRDFFGCGFIRFSKRDNCWKWECRSVNELSKIIVPHFMQYRLRTKKSEDFLLFSDCLSIIKSKHHLNVNGILKILALSYAMNGGKRKYALSDLEKHVFKRFNKINFLK